MSIEVNVCAIVGGQFGSEGKGVITSLIAHKYDVHVRTGGPNAGHSHIYKGQVFKQQVLPVGWVNPKATLVIGRGAVLDIELLLKEMKEAEATGIDVRSRLFIDECAGLMAPLFKAAEGGTKGELHRRIGSTGEGVGAARIARMRRDPDQFKLAGDVCPKHDLYTTDTVELLHTAIEEGRSILLEGTQGSGLSLIHGTWPYVTSTDTTAGQLAVDTGLPPNYVTRRILVVRTHPIRVAGNSGPLLDETTWEEMSKKLGRAVSEKTTVTQKTRRIGRWDHAVFARACQLNSPTDIALTFIDYLGAGKDEGVTKFDALSTEAKAFIQYIETVSGAKVSFVGTGGKTWHIIER